jgi:hypothetical protein
VRGAAWEPSKYTATLFISVGAPLGIIVISRRKKQSSPTTHLSTRREKRMYSSYLFTTSVIDGGEWSASRPDRALPPGKGPPVSIVQKAGWAPELVWTQRLEEKSFTPAGDRTSIARSSSP